jgi:Tfp pilus assembly protein PilN
LGPLKINLATFEYHDKRIIYTVLVCVAAFVLIISGYNIHLGIKYQNEILEYEGKLARLNQNLVKKQRIKDTRKKTLKKKEIKAIQKKTLLVNTMITRDVYPWNLILDALEKKTPEGVVLIHFSPSKKPGKLTLRGYANSTEEISKFLKELEISGVFSRNVLLKLTVDKKNMVYESDEVSPKIRFEIESSLKMKNLFAGKGFSGFRDTLARLASKQ